MTTPANLPAAFEAADFKVQDPGASGVLPHTRGFAVIPLVTTAAQSRTLPAPIKPGQILTLQLKTDGGDCTVTVTGGYDEAGGTSLVFSDSGQFVTLLSVETADGTYRWRVLSYDGVTGPTTTINALSIGGTLLTATATELNTIADLSVNGAVVKTKVLPITRVASAAEQDTGWDLPAKAVVLDAYVDVTTLEATGTTKTVDVGLLSSETNGDADGFLDGVSVAAAGVKVSSLVAGSVTRGLLLKETVTGSGAATHASPVPYSVSAGVARSVSYTLGSNNFAELVANIVIHYLEIA